MEETENVYETGATVTCLSDGTWQVPAIWPICAFKSRKWKSSHYFVWMAALSFCLGKLLKQGEKPQFIPGKNCGISKQITTMKGSELPEDLTGFECVLAEW